MSFTGLTEPQDVRHMRHATTFVRGVIFSSMSLWEVPVRLQVDMAGVAPVAFAACLPRDEVAMLGDGEEDLVARVGVVLP